MSDHQDHHDSSLEKVLKALLEWMKADGKCAKVEDLRAMEHRLTALIVNQQQPSRYIRLHVAEVRFMQPEKVNMPDNIGIDVPAGQIARMTFAPFNEKNEPAKLDGALTAVAKDDSPTPVETAVGGAGGLTVDFKMSDTEGDVGVVEVDGDADLDPAKREVLTTLVTLRRLGAVPGKAVSLGGKSENVTFVAADQFGVFPEAVARKK
jgi:hypothetical protein